MKNTGRRIPSIHVNGERTVDHRTPRAAVARRRTAAHRRAAVRGGGIHAPHTGIRRWWRAHATGPPPYTFAGSQPSLRAFGTTVHNALIAGTKIPLLVSFPSKAFCLP
ncbi:hypothetical protein FMEAI12_7200003 [Parafrankia sp. Ea1.12]|nr:hypothetical protein FMEAI12_7200003 [Parafrankia sp. Ea1.12]